MRCHKIKKLLDPFLDGELSEEKRQEVIDHLEGCSSCRQRLEALQEVETLSQQLTQAEPDEAYWQTFLPRLREKITRSEQAPAHRRIREAFGDILTPPIPWVRIASAVATAVLVFIIGRAVFQHEARMRRISALPKKLLTEQVQTAEENRKYQEDGAKQQGKSALSTTLKPREEMDQEESEMGMAPAPEESPEEKRSPEQLPSESRSTPDQELPSVSEAVPRTQPTPGGEVAPSTRQEPTESADQVVQFEIQDMEGKKRDFLFLGRAAEKTSAVTSMAMADKDSHADHWHQQIQIWQDFIEAHPRDEQLAGAYLQLADGWYHLAQLSTLHEDLLQAVEAHRAALDFATETTTRRLLRSRIQVLEKMLEKK
ncbi:MAG: hypothetical protein AMJ92_04165 [candidate division Zixibacteria bacterium SM23_81]|nr:MAG: hypothetical protein AMJ92_04165 [candidate division Zixibacteria bacterium SM23_81]